MTEPCSNPSPEVGYDVVEDHIGHFAPAHERHYGFRFLDKLSGLWHKVEELQPHPDDPSKQIGIIVFEDEIGPVADPEPVVIDAGEIRESREYKNLIIGSVATAVVVATGTLLVRHKKRS